MKKNKYLITTLIALLIISSIYLIKGIYPFGKNYAVWSDMHDQIVAMYYHFWDAVKGSESLMINFTTGGGINFIGLIGYYILSPFTLTILLFSRENVIYAATIIVALKMIAASITSLYCIDNFFKKVPDSYKILLSILYSFCGYVLISYVITAWMDAVYMLPLVAVGLKKILDLKSTKMYIITTSLLIIFSFYIAAMTLIFIIFLSTIYMTLYKTPEERKKIAFNLGISTIISLLCASFILIPTITQLLASARVNTGFDTMMSLTIGPMYDKTSYFFGSGIAIAVVLLLLFKTKLKKADKWFVILILSLLSIPVIVEPVNRVWHLSSYTGFPYRFGILTMLALTLITGYYFNNLKEQKTNNKKIHITALVTFLGIIAIIIITKIGYTDTQFTINKLTLTHLKQGYFYLFAICIITILTALTILYLNKNKSKFTLAMLSAIALTNIMSMGLLYIGIDHDQKNLQDAYIQMNELAKNKTKEDYYYLKNTEQILTRNYGMVSKYNTLTNFSSLIENNNFQTLQRLGYDAYSMDTESVGGTIFTDTLLAQKYLISDKEILDSYYGFKEKVQRLNLYEMKNTISYGYLINEIPETINAKNSFDLSNIIYKSITNKSNLFNIYDDFSAINAEVEEKDDRIFITREEEAASLVKIIEVVGKKRLYLDIFDSYDFHTKYKQYKTLNILVNGKLIEDAYPSYFRNGVLDLGTYEDTKVTITIELLGKCNFKHILVGEMDIKKYEDFANNYKINTEVKMYSNNIEVSINSIEDKILYLPITYHEDYKVTNNGEPVELLKVFDNYVGIKLNIGENNIKMTYTSPGIKEGLILTIIGLILAFMWIKYLSKLNISILEKITYKVLMAVAMLLTIVVYIIPSLFFIKSIIEKVI